MNLASPPDRNGHSSPVAHVAFRADGRRLASCSYDGAVIVWESMQAAPLARLTSLGRRQQVRAAQWNPAAADLLVTASKTRQAAVWRIVDDRPPVLLTLLDRHAEGVRSATWTADGRQLLCLTDDGDLSLWHAQTAALIARVGRRRARCVNVSVSAAGTVAAVCEDDVVAVGDLSPRRPRALRRYATGIVGCAWSPDGSTLAVLSADGVVEMVTADLEREGAVSVPPSALGCLVWVTDNHVVVGGFDGSLYVVGRGGGTSSRVRDVRFWPASMSFAAGRLAVSGLVAEPLVVSLAGG
jgi:WD40 repeat protein